jgi:hypothetical protein
MRFLFIFFIWTVPSYWGDHKGHGSSYDLKNRSRAELDAKYDAHDDLVKQCASEDNKVPGETTYDNLSCAERTSEGITYYSCEVDAYAYCISK